MRIAIDGRLLTFGGGAGQFMGMAVVSYLLKNGGKHEFFLVSNKPFLNEWGHLPNVHHGVIKPFAGLVISKKIWYDFQLPKYLIKNQIDVFLGFSGYTSLRTKVKQVLWLQDALEADTLGSGNEWSGRAYRGRLFKMARHSDSVIVPALGLLDQSKIAPGKKKINPADNFCVLPVVPEPPFILNLEKKGNKKVDLPKALSDLLHGGMTYFLCIEGWQSTGEALELLMAFSAFKKRMQSGMKLVLAGSAPKGKAFMEKLATFRYRDDVLVFPKISSDCLQVVFASAYCLIHLPGQAKFFWILSALKWRIPVITLPKAPYLELFNNTFLFCTQEPGESLAQNMMRIYKDENGRGQMIKKGAELCLNMEPSIVAEKLLFLLEPGE